MIPLGGSLNPARPKVIGKRASLSSARPRGDLESSNRDGYCRRIYEDGSGSRCLGNCPPISAPTVNPTAAPKNAARTVLSVQLSAGPSLFPHNPVMRIAPNVPTARPPITPPSTQYVGRMTRCTESVTAQRTVTRSVAAAGNG